MTYNYGCKHFKSKFLNEQDKKPLINFGGIRFVIKVGVFTHETLINFNFKNDIISCKCTVSFAKNLHQ